MTNSLPGENVITQARMTEPPYGTFPIDNEDPDNESHPNLAVSAKKNLVA